MTAPNSFVRINGAVLLTVSCACALGGLWLYWSANHRDNANLALLPPEFPKGIPETESGSDTP